MKDVKISLLAIFSKEKNYKNLAKKLEEELLLYGHEISFFSRYIHSLNKNDINKIIKKISTSEINIFLKDKEEHDAFGLLLQLSLENRKPSIIFSLLKKTPCNLSFFKHEKLIIRVLSEKNLENAVNLALKKAFKFRDKRFNFYIPAELLNYLDKISRLKGKTKATLIRELIIKYKKENPLSQ